MINTFIVFFNVFGLSLMVQCEGTHCCNKAELVKLLPSKLFLLCKD